MTPIAGAYALFQSASHIDRSNPGTTKVTLTIYELARADTFFGDIQTNNRTPGVPIVGTRTEQINRAPHPPTESVTFHTGTDPDEPGFATGVKLFSGQLVHLPDARIGLTGTWTEGLFELVEEKHINPVTGKPFFVLTTKFVDVFEYWYAQPN